MGVGCGWASPGQTVPRYSAGPAGCFAAHGSGWGAERLAADLGTLFPGGAECRHAEAGEVLRRCEAAGVTVTSVSCIVSSCEADVTGDGARDTIMVAAPSPVTTADEGPAGFVEPSAWIVSSAEAGARPAALGPIRLFTPDTGTESWAWLADEPETVFQGLLLAAADVDGDGRREIVARATMVGASWLPTWAEVIEIEGGVPRSAGVVFGESDVWLRDLDGNGTVEFLCDQAIGEFAHYQQPRWVEISSVVGGRMVNVSERFPEKAGVPLVELLDACRHNGADPRTLPEMSYYIARRYDLNQRRRQACQWYGWAAEANREQMAQISAEAGPDGHEAQASARVAERIAAIEARLAELGG